MMIAGLFNKSSICWICLEESNFDHSWIKHECGCNLQLHKKCYIKWLLNINRSQIAEQWNVDSASVVLDSELPKKLCYLMDGHRDLYRSITSAEIVASIPIIGKQCFRLMCVPFVIGFDTFGFRYISRMLLAYEPLKLPITHANCPQCKKPAETKTVEFTGSSTILKLFFFIKRILRSGTVMTAIALSSINIGKWWFKLGLWQLRRLFPEETLKQLLEISTTHALDVYAESINGLLSIPDATKFVVMGFPIYLYGLIGSSVVIDKWKWLWPLIASVKLSKNQDSSTSVAYHTINVAAVVIGAYSALFSPMLETIYAKMVQEVKPYYYQSEEKIIHEITFQPTSSILLRSNWYDIAFESIVWILVGPAVGEHTWRMLLKFQKIRKLNCNFDLTPNEFSMIFRFVGMGLVAGFNQGLKLYLSMLRKKELEDLQQSIAEVI